MMGLTALRGRRAGATGIVRHVTQGTEKGGPEDYYRHEKGAGTYWIGSGTQAITGHEAGEAVASEDAVAALENRRADGTAVVKGVHSATIDRRIKGYDLTFSSPKSASIAWGNGDPEVTRIFSEAQRHAVAAAIRHAETLGLCSTGRGELGPDGKFRVNTTTGKLAAACYEHGTSREGDEDQHTHALLSNAIARDSDGKVMSVNNTELYHRQYELGAVYRAAYCEYVEEHGVRTERDKDWFRITGIPDDLVSAKSTRRQQIEAELKKRGLTGSKASEIASLATRRGPLDIDPATLQQTWRKEAAEYGVTPETLRGLIGARRELAAEFSPEQRTALLESLTKDNAHFTKYDVLRAVAVEAQGVLKVSAIPTMQEELLASRDLVQLTEDSKGRMRYTTRDQLNMEQKFLSQTSRMVEKTDYAVTAEQCAAGIAKYEQQRGFTLTREQRLAVEHITQGGDLAVVNGGSGTGKSTLLGAARTVWQSAGLEVRGAATGGKAARGLEASSHIASHTLASMLAQSREWTDDQGRIHPPSNPIRRGQVLVCDEAAMIASADLAALSDLCHQAGAKLVAIGDVAQLQSIGPGGGMKGLMDRHMSGELKEIYRQKEQWQRDMVRKANEGDTRGALLDLYRNGGLRIVADHEEALRAVAQGYLHNDIPGQLDHMIVICNTRQDARGVNDLIRAGRREAGHLKGEDLEINTREGKLHIAEGDVVQTKLKDKALDVQNGDLWTVRKIEGSVLELEGDKQQTRRIDTAEYTDFRHGYAVTTHSTQAATVDRAEGLPGGNMQDAHSTLVQISRQKDGITMTVTQEQLDDAMERTAPTREMREDLQRIGIEGEALDDLTGREAVSILRGKGGWTEEQQREAEIGAIGDAWGRDRTKVLAADLLPEAKPQTIEIKEVEMDHAPASAPTSAPVAEHVPDPPSREPEQAPGRGRGEEMGLER